MIDDPQGLALLWKTVWPDIQPFAYIIFALLALYIGFRYWPGRKPRE